MRVDELEVRPADRGVNCGPAAIDVRRADRGRDDEGLLVVGRASLADLHLRALLALEDRVVHRDANLLVVGRALEVELLLLDDDRVLHLLLLESREEFLDVVVLDLGRVPADRAGAPDRGLLEADEVGLGRLDLLRQRRCALGEVGGLDGLPHARGGGLELGLGGRERKLDDVGAQVDVPGHDGYVAAGHCGSSRDGYGAGGEDRNEGDTAGSHRKVSPDRFPDGHIWHVVRTMLQARDGRCADLAAVSR